MGPDQLVLKKILNKMHKTWCSKLAYINDSQFSALVEVLLSEVFHEQMKKIKSRFVSNFKKWF